MCRDGGHRCAHPTLRHREVGFANFSWIGVTNRGGSDDAQRIDRTNAAAIAVAPAIPARGYRCGAGVGLGAAVAGVADRLHIAAGVARAGLE